MFKAHKKSHHPKRQRSAEYWAMHSDRFITEKDAYDLNFLTKRHGLRDAHPHSRFAAERGDRHQGPRGHRSGGHGGHHDRPSFLRGRKFGADELQLLLLSLLKEQASYGYELIKMLSERSGNFYTPSPGVVYPALSYMEDVGYVTVQQEGTRKRYIINASGESYLLENKALAEALLEKLSLFARHSDSVNQAMREQRQPFIPELKKTIQELRDQLHCCNQSSDEAQHQIVVILQQTIEQLKSIKKAE